MEYRNHRTRSSALPGLGTLALCLLSAGVLASGLPAQDQGGKDQGGKQQGKPEAAPAKQRQPAAAPEASGGDLAGELARLQNEFSERLRGALRGTDAGKHGKPLADELVVTMFGSDHIIAGYPVESSAAPAAKPTGAGEPGGSAGGATGSRGGNDQEKGGVSSGGEKGNDKGAEQGANRPANAMPANNEGEVLGVLVVARPKPSDSSRPVDAGGNPGQRGPNDASNAGAGEMLAAGIYEVRLIDGNTLAIVGDAGTPLRKIPWHEAAVKRIGAGGAEGSGEGQRENPAASNPAGAGQAAAMHGEMRPSWSKVYLTIVTDLAPSFLRETPVTR